MREGEGFFFFPSGSGVKCAGCLHLACKCTVNQPFIGCNKYPGGRAAWPRSRPRRTRSFALSLMRRPSGMGGSARERERGEHFILAGGCQEGRAHTVYSTHTNSKHPNVISIPAHANTLADVRPEHGGARRFNDLMLTLTRSQQQQNASAGSSQLACDCIFKKNGSERVHSRLRLTSVPNRMQKFWTPVSVGSVASVIHA